MSNTPHLTEIKLHRRSRRLELAFDSGEQFDLSAEYMRVYSPSADVQGHSPEQAVLQEGKREVGIDRIEAVGQYALRLFFDDGHNTGIYAWKWLYELGADQAGKWQNYLDRLEAAGGSRDA